MSKTLYVMRDINLVLGDETTGPDFKCEVSKIEVNGETKTVTAEAACPRGNYSGVGNTTWEIKVTYINLLEDDPTSADNMFDFLRKHVGEKMLLTWRPVAGGKGYSATVTVPAGSFSGEVNKSTDASVTFGVDGDIKEVAAKPPAPTPGG